MKKEAGKYTSIREILELAASNSNKAKKGIHFVERRGKSIPGQFFINKNNIVEYIPYDTPGKSIQVTPRNLSSIRWVDKILPESVRSEVVAPAAVPVVFPKEKAKVVIRRLNAEVDRLRRSESDATELFQMANKDKIIAQNAQTMTNLQLQEASQKITSLQNTITNNQQRLIQLTDELSAATKITGEKSVIAENLQKEINDVKNTLKNTTDELNAKKV